MTEKNEWKPATFISLNKTQNHNFEHRDSQKFAVQYFIKVVYEQN